MNLAHVAPYGADLTALEEYGPRFVELAPDEGTAQWLADNRTPHGALRSWFVRQLAEYVSIYDAHGLTGSYPMHLLSTAQFTRLLGDGHDRLLDVGAGGGYVTAQAAPLFRTVTCTETSASLARRLGRRGYALAAPELTGIAPGSFDVITCLNVLDRTRRPKSLLRTLHASCTNDTKLLVAMPLPVSAHVPVAAASVTPAERLPDRARTFEAAAVELGRGLFEACGFGVVSLSRVPYYSRGDSRAPHYVLDDAVWLLARD